MERASMQTVIDERVPRRPVMLIEDDSDDLSYIDKSSILAAGFDLVICSGPASAHDECPLVMEGSCPAGRPDVVVCDLHGEWRRSVERAWCLEGVPVVTTGGVGDAGHHLGAALCALLLRARGVTNAPMGPSAQ